MALKQYSHITCTIAEILVNVALQGFYLPRSGKVMQKCRSKIRIKGLMDLETLKPLFLVLFGIILSSFEPVIKLLLPPSHENSCIRLLLAIS